ncbi:hypothetical protein ACO0LM_23215 [Undibacterium sp. Di26W]|uniref:hypothetical protein n=1 Tax=Undibacterium sp. Di26W TaxID=3413035 RepID=UPI003BEF7741
MKNEKKSRNIDKRDIIFVSIFLLIVCIPLGLIPFFPGNVFFNTLYTNSIALGALFFGGVIVSMIVDKLLYRGRLDNNDKS